LKIIPIVILLCYKYDLKIILNGIFEYIFKNNFFIEENLYDYIEKNLYYLIEKEEIDEINLYLKYYLKENSEIFDIINKSSTNINNIINENKFDLDSKILTLCNIEKFGKFFKECVFKKDINLNN
jgi:hypothetical protein